MCYHEIENEIRLQEFGIRDRILNSQITIIVITVFSIHFNGTSHTKLKLRLEKMPLFRRLHLKEFVFFGAQIHILYIYIYCHTKSISTLFRNLLT